MQRVALGKDSRLELVKVRLPHNHRLQFDQVAELGPLAHCVLQFGHVVLHRSVLGLNPLEHLNLLGELIVQLVILLLPVVCDAVVLDSDFLNFMFDFELEFPECVPRRLLNHFFRVGLLGVLAVFERLELRHDLILDFRYAQVQVQNVVRDLVSQHERVIESLLYFGGDLAFQLGDDWLERPLKLRVDRRSHPRLKLCYFFAEEAYFHLQALLLLREQSAKVLNFILALCGQRPLLPQVH